MSHAGFVYLITNLLTGKAYVGKKFFKSKIKGKTRQSDWRRYYGSCKPLKEDIKALGVVNFHREILAVFKLKGQVNYGEVEEQIKRDVLKAVLPDGSRAYYNGNIMSRWFAPDYEKVAEANRGVPLSQERKDKIAAAHRGKPKGPMSEEHKLKLSQANTGRKVVGRKSRADLNKIKAIKTDLASGMTQSATARKHGYTVAYVHDIFHGRFFADIQPEAE